MTFVEFSDKKLCSNSIVFFLLCIRFFLVGELVVFD